MSKTADFYSLDADSQALRMRDLANAALTRWPGRYSDLSLIKYRENAVFSVRDATGNRFALRIHRHAYHTDAELRSELEWMTALRGSGIRVPEIIPALDGSLFVHATALGVPEPRQVDMLGWLNGQPVGAIESLGDTDADKMTGLYHAAGVLAATLHNQSSSWARPASFVRHSWDEQGLLGKQPFWGQFRDLPALNESAETRKLIDEACIEAERQLHAYGKSPQKYGLIHADFVPENLLRDGDTLMLIDFDDAGFGWHMFELATALYFYLDEPYFQAISDALATGYRSVRALDERDWSLLPLFLLLRSLTYLGWVHTRHETETAQQLTPMFVDRTAQLAKNYLAGLARTRA